MSPGISIVICCHNSAKRLPETLRHLSEQNVSNGIPWEVVVVDNGSTDDTRQVAQSFWPNFPAGQLRVVDEPCKGLSHARMRGVKEAAYGILCYVDDDNWVAPNWVALVHEFFSTTPSAGALGGKGSPVFESGPPPAWFGEFSGAYAARAQHEGDGDITDNLNTLLWGAGLCVRAKIFEQLDEIGFKFNCTGRLGATLSSGEDVELCMAIRGLGWRLFYDPRLSYQHFIPSARLSWAYLRRIFEGAGQSAVFVQNLNAATNRTWSRGRLKLERSWLFQVLRALISLAELAVKNPLGIVTDAEGASERLQADALLGFLKTLFHLRGRYASLLDINRNRFIDRSSVDPERSPQ